jgi:hypothetical protein
MSSDAVRMRRNLVVVLLVAACGGSSATPDAGPADASIDAPVLPVFRNPVSLGDSELALQALQILGAGVSGAATNSCNGCHGITKQHLNTWRALSDTARINCLTDLQVSSQANAQRMIDCIRAMPALPDSDFATSKLGIYSTAAKLPWFAYTFWKAYGADGPAKLAAFQAMAGMPKPGVPDLTQEQFDIIAEWFVRGLPKLDATLVTDPPPTTCTPSISADVAAHVSALATTSWRSVNAQNHMNMFGCGTQTDPKLCLSTVPLGVDQPFGTGWDLPNRGHLRVLKDVTYVTSYWTRSSPDGRFVAHGVSSAPGSYIVDLQRNATVGINVAYDPGFFPDGSGFVFQGGTRNTCGISVLTSNPPTVESGTGLAISTTEAACRSINQIGLYQHVGQQLGAGGDYFAIDSEFVSDDGGKNVTIGDPATSFNTQAYSSFTPMIFDGTTYVPHPSVDVSTPFEGDTVLSPSAKLTIGRVAGPNDRQLGFVLRKVNATPVGSTGFTIDTPEIARYCMSGGKPAFSYDERWLVYHHYITAADYADLGFASAQDPGFQPYLQRGAANVYLMDLRTGVPVRITNMKPGQYALFPHFRSDGWIYAQVRDSTVTPRHEYIVASDAALLAE